jgi:Homing endonuclease associated repeat
VFVMELDGPFLAGFVAGEAHFWISQNNAGQSWCCGFALCQRDDNAELLESARCHVGCGELCWTPPHRTSHGQVNWLVQTMGDCSALAAALGRLHLLGKKAGELAIWRRAVSLWTDRALGRQRWRHLERLAFELRAHRKPDFVADYTRVDITQVALASFLAGFTSAEGHFGASSDGHPRFVIKLRADDAAVLALLARRFGVGRLVPAPATLRGRSQMAWLVTTLDELRALIPVFDRHRPLGRAARVYEHWRRLVLARERSRCALETEAARLRAARRYRARTTMPTRPSPRASKQERYVAVLRAWADATGPPYTATSYERWRSGSAHHAPSRNTLARFFGSWRDALAAADLPRHGSRPRETNARAIDTAAPARVAAASRRRAAVLRAVDRCSTALGRVPTASEFLRWRLVHARDSPSQAEVYRLFAGGWAAVLDAMPPLGMTEPEASTTASQPLQPPAQPLHVPSPAREQLAREPHVQAGSVDQLRHEGVAGHEVAAWQRE